MTALIKNGDRAGLLLVHPVGTSPAPPVSAPPDVPAAEENRTAHLEAALSEARGNLAALRRQHAVDLEKTRADAHAEGVAEGVRRNEALLESLARAAERGETAIAEGLEGSAMLALAIARAALGQLFADRGQWKAMIGDIVATRRAQVDDNLLLGIRVSAKDFPDDAELAGIAHDDDRVTLVADPKLASGDCLFELRLGEMEVGPATQGRNLLAFLDRQLTSGEKP